MGQNTRDKPKHLAGKLLAVRKHLELSQSQIAKRVGITTGYARVSEYERGIREPSLVVVMGYAKLAKVPMAHLVDDRVELVFPKRRRKSQVGVLSDY